MIRTARNGRDCPARPGSPSGLPGMRQEGNSSGEKAGADMPTKSIRKERFEKTTLKDSLSAKSPPAGAGGTGKTAFPQGPALLRPSSWPTPAGIPGCCFSGGEAEPDDLHRGGTLDVYA